MLSVFACYGGSNVYESLVKESGLKGTTTRVEKLLKTMMFVALRLLIIRNKSFYILVYFVVEFGNAFVCPVFSKLR